MMAFLQNDTSLEITAKNHQKCLFFLLLIDERKQLHCKASGLYRVAVRGLKEGEKKKKGGGSKTCDCHRRKTKTEIMLHIQEIFSCWNKLGAHKRRRVRSEHTH